MAIIFGTDSNDVLLGAAPIPRKDPGPTDPWLGALDLIDGKAGDDSISAGEGGDSVLGGAGRDTIEGGAGHDTILPAGGSALTRVEQNEIDGGDGNDWVSYEDEALASVILSLDGSFSYDRIVNVENLRGGGGADRLTGNADRNRLEGLNGRDTLFGARGNDTLLGGAETGAGDDLYGGAGNDSLDGGDGNDRIDGGSGTDLLLGGSGTDAIDGGRGDDTLVGGPGADTLSGGQGDNLFVFAQADEGGDRILDYRGNHDAVWISAAGFGGGLAVGQDLLATGAYIEASDGLATAPTGTGQLIFDPGTGRLLWDADGAGGAAAVLILELVAARQWSAAEIILV